MGVRPHQMVSTIMSAGTRSSQNTGHATTRTALDAWIVRATWEQAHSPISEERAATKNVLVCQGQDQQTERFKRYVVKNGTKLILFILSNLRENYIFHAGSKI